MSLAARDRLGPYEIVAPLGAGGMGEVFRALDTRLHRTVAIKLLSGDRMADLMQRRRFLQEARAASALNHPNIVVLYDISSHEGIDFLVMECVAGQTLKTLIPEQGLPLESVAAIGAQVASALAAAHAAGIVHRDIKPANIMVTPDQHVKVLDFGVAKMNMRAALADPDAQTATLVQDTVPGVVVGTVAYMSPEQTRGEAVDGRSDLFSLGCVLYQAATGRQPFTGPSTLAVMHEIATAAPPSPSSLRPDLPPAFDQLIAACLQKNPGARPPSAADVGRDLKALAASGERVPLIRPVTRRSIAVVPFRFRTAAAEDQFLSVALSDAVSNRLGSNGKLLVRPTAAVLRYSGTETEWTQVARELNVDVVIEGTIQKMGPRIRVLVQAYQASDSQTLHSARHDGDVNDLFGLQDRIADAVSDVFSPRGDSTADTALPPTLNALAYELYLRAVDRLQHLNKFDIGSAIEILTRVIDLDPNFADAWGLLAHAYSQIGMHFDPDPQWFEKAEHAIAKALELDPVQCDALCARGQVLWSPSRGFQNGPALRALSAAVKINPSRVNARMLRAAVLVHLGFYDDAEPEVKETLLLNPAYAMGLQVLGFGALYRGNYAAADEYFDRCLAMEPALVLGNIFAPIAPILLGRLEVAREKMRKARQMVPDEPQLICLDGLIAAHEGNFRHAEQLADDAASANRKSVTHTHHTWHHAAQVYALCGKPEKALPQLRRCAEFGLPNYRLFTSDPALRPLKDNAEFGALMSELRRQHDRYRAEFSLSDATR